MGSQASEARRPWRRWAFLLLSVQLILLGVGFFVAPVHIDEAWIGEMAWFTAAEGAPRSEAFPGLSGLEQRVVLVHFWFVYAGAAMVKALGWSLDALRVVPLVCSVVLLLLLMRHFSRQHRPPWMAPFSAALFLVLPLGFKYSITYRPEAALALLGFLSFLCLIKIRDKSSWAAALLAGAAAGGGAATHANGLIFVLAGWVMLGVWRRWWGALLFTLGAAAAAGPYLWTISQHYDLFQEQLQNPFAGAKVDEGLHVLSNLLQEHKRLFRKPETIIPTLLLMGAVGIQRKRLKDPWMWAYLGLVLLGLGCLQGKTTKYFVLAMPLVVIHITESLCLVLEKPKKTALETVFLGMLALTLTYGLTHSVYTAMVGRPPLEAAHRSLAASMAPGARVLGPMEFMFNELPHHSVVSLMGAAADGHSDTGTGLAKYAARYGCNYLVLNQEWARRVAGVEKAWDLTAEAGPVKLYVLKQDRAELRTPTRP